MKKTMTSINPPFSNLILDGLKKIEWRTKPLPLGWSELYETKKKGGAGKVIGQFEVVKNIKFNLKGDTYKNSWLEQGFVPYEFLVEYTKGKDYLYANVIGKVERYDRQRELSEFKHICPARNIDTCYGCPYFIKTELSVYYNNIIKAPPRSYIYIEV